MLSLWVNILLSCIGSYISYQIILEYIPVFVKRQMYGKDQCKVNNIPIPEPIGVISAAVYLIVMFIFIPFPVYEWSQLESSIPHQKFLMFLSALTAICSAVLLGFADDVLDLRWRHKLLFPTLSSLPLLLVYYVSGSSATIVLPSLVRILFPVRECIDIGIFYYIYMGMMIVFCTNAINILAGINGLEAGQAFIIAASVVIFNVIELFRLDPSLSWYHSLSLYFLLPFLGTTSVLLFFNWYPARVFVGDTFCYWAGMTLASACILGHFSKTMALFLIPQIFNFIYSTPQLLHLVPCPRHRLPKYDSKTNTIDMSTIEFKENDLKPLTKIILYFLDISGLLYKKIIQKDDVRSNARKKINEDTFNIASIIFNPSIFYPILYRTSDV
ncbi:UDP-N-acetylglucosamine--dolichyl-phosphate N-acetylglucosaminephosphotransferase family protein [Onchocerca flexuosa]|uniref:UDP-N-acetylglucosamine--dolichyl-phosphate N-acetylglucosaminephosphotransferase n=1 Tax=Onchocerca flexuosa TaxID=387005 RepID=A0A238BKJ2_9BILA|nr:UDP-N-acetylglucosamine--dolichyl-phosphate N-acetylglucosaminephosphotransferase family protein [Onchocerca flexuosa]